MKNDVVNERNIGYYRLDDEVKIRAAQDVKLCNAIEAAPFAINCKDDLLNWFERPIFNTPIAHIHLPSAVIEGSYLVHAKIMGDVNLAGAVIEGSLYLTCAKIMGDVNLAGAVIRGNLYLSGAVIEGNLDLSGVSCEAYYDIRLTDAKIKGSVNLSGLRAFSIRLMDTIVNPASLTPVAPITPATIAFLKSIPLDKLDWADVLYYLKNKHVHPNPDELYPELKHLFHMNNKQALKWVKYYTTEYNLQS